MAVLYRQGAIVTPRAGLQHSPPPTNAAVVDRVFRALSDPTRRNVLERLSLRPASASELAAPYDMALPSFVEHLKVLEGSGLVRSHKAGRVRTYELAAEQLKLAEDWLGRQRNIWERRLDQLDSYLLKLKEEEAK
ncbi:MAG: helix-turn-helix transcriptional regulator [Mesorhizobium sp.]|jgi:DNA-binding transcriptional ArsR family regulator|nr:helix-turn-helix transcriptional regulator [Mesorhizobium sp.]